LVKRLSLSIPRLAAGVRYRLTEAAWARTLRSRLLGAKGRSPMERNIRYLYIEIFWAAIFSAVFAFNATYALRLGASNTMVGWLSSLPSLFAMFLMLPAARFLETKSNRGPWLYGGLFIGRIVFIGAVLIPWLFKSHQAEILVWLFILRTVPVTFFNTGFSPMLADVIPERDRARVFANRNIILSGVTAIASLLAGKWLDAASQVSWAAFPMNYQVVYAVGTVGAVVSAFYVSKIKAPPTKIIPREVHPRAARPSIAQMAASLRTLWMENRGFMRTAFGRITVNTLVFNLGAWLVMPLYTILFVKQLNATDGWIGLNSTLANLGVIAGYAVWQKVIHKLGDHRVLLLTVPLSASYAFLVSFFPNLTVILIWGILINLINPGVNLSHTNIFYKLCPEDRRASYMALYSSVMNVGAFVCPMVGVALADVMDIRWVLIIGGIIRLFGALMFHFWKVNAEEKEC
jgi:MFS family permease